MPKSKLRREGTRPDRGTDTRAHINETAASALKGNVDYLDLAERVGQGVTVEATTPDEQNRAPRSRSKRSIHSF